MSDSYATTIAAVAPVVLLVAAVEMSTLRREKFGVWFQALLAISRTARLVYRSAYVPGEDRIEGVWKAQASVLVDHKELRSRYVGWSVAVAVAYFASAAWVAYELLRAEIMALDWLAAPDPGPQPGRARYLFDAVTVGFAWTALVPLLAVAGPTVFTVVQLAFRLPYIARLRRDLSHFDKLRHERRILSARTQTALESTSPGSRTSIAGSRRWDEADTVADIDLVWIVQDEDFPGCLQRAVEVLGREVRTVQRVRFDPDFLHSQKRRLMYVRFQDTNVFWRVDLDVRCASVADDDRFDADNPEARASDEEWSRPASALENAVAAHKEMLRGSYGNARQLLARGFARMGSSREVSVDAYGDYEALRSAVVDLVARCRLREPDLEELAGQVIESMRHPLGHRWP